MKAAIGTANLILCCAGGDTAGQNKGNIPAGRITDQGGDQAVARQRGFVGMIVYPGGPLHASKRQRQLPGAISLDNAVRTFRQKPEDEEREAASAPDTPSFLGGFMTGLSLTLTNPATILAFIAVFAGFGLGANLDTFDAATMVLGVFLGASSWWLALSSGVAAVRHRITDQGLILLNHCTGIGLGCFGLWALGTAFIRIVSAG